MNATGSCGRSSKAHEFIVGSTMTRDIQCKLSLEDATV
jgi:hypothetical protein